MDDEAKLVDDLLFSKEVLIGYVDRKEVPNQRRELKAYLTAAEKRTRKPGNISHPCRKGHNLYTCLEYKKTCSRKKNQILFRKKLSVEMSVAHQYDQNTMPKTESKGK